MENMTNDEYKEAIAYHENRYTAEEAIDENPRITAKRARQLVLEHGASWGEFLDDNRGENGTYGMGDVLLWLGY